MSEAENEGHFEVFWPRTRRQTRIKRLAKRRDTFAGKRIAFLWDYLFRGDEIYALLEQELKARYPGVTFIDWREFGNVHGNEERAVVAALPKRMKELKVDAVICGMGC